VTTKPEPNLDHPNVREGALLRLASGLLCPEAEFGGTRAELLSRLERFGIRPEVGAHRLGPFWIEGECEPPEPRDEVTIFKRQGDTWVIGYWERGSFDVRHRFGNEGDACRWMMHHLLSHEVTSMGWISVGSGAEVGPHVREPFRSALLDALSNAAELVARTPPTPKDV